MSIDVQHNDCDECLETRMTSTNTALVQKKEINERGSHSLVLFVHLEGIMFQK
jgi:hypothetical protein